MVFSFQILGRQQNTSVRHGLAFMLLGLSALAGCGQKGPLFLAVPVTAAPAIASSLPATAPVPTPTAAPALPASAAQ